MGYAGKLEYKAHAQQLRSKGYSYKDILHKIPVSKNTISRWCRDIPLSVEQQKSLTERQREGGRLGSFIGAKLQQQRREFHAEQCFAQGLRKVHHTTSRERLLIGIALYAAEGTKTDGRFEFTNADPRLITVMASWLREFFTIDETRLRGVIWIHEENNIDEATNHWSRIAGIPISQFHKPYIVPVKESRKIRKNKHVYGVFSLRYSDVSISRQLQGLIAGLLHDPWYNNRTIDPS